MTIPASSLPVPVSAAPATGALFGAMETAARMLWRRRRTRRYS